MRKILTSSLATLALLLGGIGVAVVVTTGGDGKGGFTTTLGFTVDAPDEAAAANVHTDLRDEEAPAGIDDQVADELRADNSALSAAAAPSIASFPGCQTRFNSNNFSSRRGAPILLGVAHYTVSPNVPGLDDVLANARFLDNPRTQASANLIIDAEGNCLYTVNVADKAWTQGFYNPWSASIECIARGPESKAFWLAHGCFTKGVKVMARILKAAGVPARLGLASGCEVARSGILDHDALGCGNTHTDTRPNFPMGTWIELIRRQMLTCDRRVRPLERALHDRVDQAIVVDTFFGPRAKRALKRFQERQGLPATGVPDREARFRLGLCR